uniref:Uncharacterized protein n=1 Tax=Arundo donax TaxID=35708 RepID=A0A0A9DI66_ARUDO
MESGKKALGLVALVAMMVVLQLMAAPTAMATTTLPDIMEAATAMASSLPAKELEGFHVAMSRKMGMERLVLSGPEQCGFWNTCAITSGCNPGCYCDWPLCMPVAGSRRA